MPKIGKLEIYPFDPDLGPEDYWIGTNGSTGRNKKTQNFSLGAVAEFIRNYISDVGVNQNNIGKVKIFALTDAPTLANIVTNLNNLPQYVIDQYQDQWYQALVFTPVVEGVEPTTRSEVAYMINIRLINVGKGVYGVGGTQLNSTHLHIVGISYPTIANINAIPTTQVIDYGSIDNSVEQWVNENDPAITLKSQEFGYVVLTGVIEGLAKDYLFIGEGGDYGVGGLTATALDFQLLSGEAVVNSLDNVLAVGNLTNKIARFWTTLQTYYTTISGNGLSVNNPNNTTQVSAGNIQITNTVTNKLIALSGEVITYFHFGIQKKIQFGLATLAQNSNYQLPNKPYNSGTPYTLAVVEEMISGINTASLVTTSLLGFDVNSCPHANSLYFLPTTTVIGKQVLVISAGVTANNIQIFANAAADAKMFETFGTNIASVTLTPNQLYRFTYLGYGTGAGGVVNGFWKAENLSTVVGDTRPYKSYVALISQTGTNDPTLVVLENTLGQTVTVTRNAAGRYVLNVSGSILLATKTAWNITNDNNNNWFFWMNKENGLGNTTTIYIDTGSPSPLTYTDGLLQSTPFEIRVYN